jgi:hypothetical protein
MTRQRLFSLMKRICVIGTPLLAGHLSSYLLQIADTAMVGRLGREPLAAIAIATMVGGILSTFVWPVTVGTQAITARRFGRQNAETERPLPNASSPDSSDLDVRQVRSCPRIGPVMARQRSRCSHHSSFRLSSAPSP